MERKTINVHAFTVHMYSIAIIVLLLFIGVLGLKYLHLRLAVENFTEDTIMLNSQSKPTGNLSDYARVIGLSSSQFVKSEDLENYVGTLSSTLHRDIVVLDKNKKILADTVAVNVGKTYSFDLNDEIKSTLADGQTRSFEERSTDYESLVLVVVPMKDKLGSVTGAVLISSSEIK